MMNAFKLQMLVLVFLTGCLGCAPPQGQQNYSSSDDPYAPREDEDYDTLKDEDPNRREILDQNTSDDKCADEKRQHECHTLCKEMYKRNNDKEDCEELSSNTIVDIYDVHTMLENPNSSNLLSISPEKLEVYLNISIAAFDRLIGEYSKNDAKDVLSWIAQSYEMATLFQNEDDEYRSFTYLLEVASSSFDKDELDEPFSQNIDGNNTLFELAIGNEVALEWFQDYIFETATQCTDEDDEEVVADCFEIFCQIGDSFGGNASDKYNREDWMNNSSNFNSYLDDIIEEGINSVNATANDPDIYYWGVAEKDNTYEDTGDLDDWVEDLCENGKTDLT